MNNLLNIINLTHNNRAVPIGAALALQYRIQFAHSNALKLP